MRDAEQNLPLDELRPKRVTIAVTDAEYFALRRFEVIVGSKKMKLGPSLTARLFVQGALEGETRREKPRR